MGLLTRFVLKAAAEQWGTWRRSGIDTSVAVNVSGNDIGDPAFEATLREVLLMGVPPERLEIEITEDAMMAQPEKAVAALRRLRERGITITIDDFGVGHSSLAYLRHFPIDVLKIDRSFVEAVGIEETDPVLARAIIALGRTLQISTIAEGIERPEQREGLRKLGCSLGQGYLFAKPMTSQRFIDEVLNRSFTPLPSLLVPEEENTAKRRA